MKACLHCGITLQSNRRIYCRTECRNADYNKIWEPNKTIKAVPIPNRKKRKLKTRARVVSKHSMKHAYWNREKITI